MLAKLPVPRPTVKAAQRAFGGLERRPGVRSALGAGGALSLVLREAENLSGEQAPLLASRRPRPLGAALQKPNGLFSHGGALVAADGTALRIGGETVGAVSDSPKVFASLGSRLLIWPDKLIWDGETLSPLQAECTVSGLVFSDGTFAGEPAKANSITTSGAAPFPFRAGDAVTVSGCAAVPENNKTPVVREISGDGKTLRFYENVFTLPEGQTAVTEPGPVTLRRAVPELDFLCVCDNRVWGCRGDTVWCCKPGDPYNWNVFDGLSTDAWRVESGTAGPFTACCAFMGYPVFFKEDRVFKVYGSRPSNFELLGAATLGVLPGCEKSLAVAGETLYYLSRAGVVGYRGGFPAAVSRPLEDGRRYTRAAAGSDGSRCFLCLGDGERFENLVYEPDSGLWRREDARRFTDFAFADGALWGLGADGALQAVLAPPGALPELPREEGLEAAAEFAPLDCGRFMGKYPVRLRLRGRGAALAAEIAFDGGPWESAGIFRAADTAAGCLTLPLRRCDRFALRLRGPAPWSLDAAELELTPGAGSR